MVDPRFPTQSGGSSAPRQQRHREARRAERKFVPRRATRKEAQREGSAEKIREGRAEEEPQGGVYYVGRGLGVESVSGEDAMPKTHPSDDTRLKRIAL